MMKPYRIQAISLTLAGMRSLPVRAKVIPGRWEKAAAISVETPITVDLKNGDRIKGQFEGLSPSELSLRTHSTQAAIPRSEIHKITTPKLDGLWFKRSRTFALFTLLDPYQYHNTDISLHASVPAERDCLRSVSTAS